MSECALHRTHRPPNLTLESHHIIPVAWQLFWTPEQEPYPGNDPSGRGHLWDARTVTLCPTGHRNVHAWITRLMHQLAVPSRPKGAKELEWARAALVRFVGVGGILDSLRAAGDWGQA